MGANWQGKADRQLWRSDLDQLSPTRISPAAKVVAWYSTMNRRSLFFEKLRLQNVVRFADGGMDVDVAGGPTLTDIAARIGLGLNCPICRHLPKNAANWARHYFAKIDPELGLELPVADF